MPLLRLCCLGTFSAVFDDGRALNLTASKQMLLLARLALAGNSPVDRQQIVALLWGDRGEEQARNSLRQALWAIRKKLGDRADRILEQSGQKLRLVPEAVSVDVVEFEAAVETGTAEALGLALRLYRGELLSGWDLLALDPDGAMAAERERLRELAGAAAKSLAEICIAAGRGEQGIAAARRALEIDPLQEDVYRLLIAHYRDQGQTGLAVREYEACYEVLHGLGVTPADATLQLRKSLDGPHGVIAMKSESQPKGLRPSQPSGVDEAAAPRMMSSRVAIWTAVTVLLGLGAGVAYFGLLPDRKPAIAYGDFPTIAILPIEDMSILGQQRIYADGLTADLTTDLAKLSRLRVVDRDTVMRLEDDGLSVLEIADALGVKYVLRGSLRRSRGIVRINAQLIAADTAQHVWSNRYDRDLDDLFELQSEIVREIASTLGVSISERELASIARIPTGNLAAYDHFMRGEHRGDMGREPDAAPLKIRDYEQAIALDPGFAEAHSALAETLVQVYRRDLNNVMPTRLARVRAYESASEALRLDPNNARAHVTLSLLQLTDGEFEAAISSARQAVAKDPGNAKLNANLALTLAFSGRAQEADRVIGTAMQQTPVPSTELLAISGIVAFETRRYDEAAEALELAAARNPNSELVNEHLAAAYAFLGNSDRAAEILDRLNGDFEFTVNLAFYRATYSRGRVPEQQEHFLEGLALAGMPQWPFGLEYPGEQQVTGEELAAIAFGRQWVGQLNNGSGFFQEIAANGDFAYRSGVTLQTGNAKIENDWFCQTSDSELLGQPACGPIYRIEDDKWEYVYLAPLSVRSFSVAN